MAEFRFTQRAEADLVEIGDYTLRQWGEDQAVRYIDDLETSCRGLAENPALGRRCDHIRPGLRRMECGSHVLFYRAVTDGILVSRILHQRMLPERHSMED